MALKTNAQPTPATAVKATPATGKLKGFPLFRSKNAGSRSRIRADHSRFASKHSCRVLTLATSGKVRLGTAGAGFRPAARGSPRAARWWPS